MDNKLTAAIVFLTREGDAPALMLEPILFDSAARWLAESLRRAGVEDFLVACHRDDRERAQSAFPQGTVFVSTGADHARDELHTFLEKVSGQVAMFTRPVFLDEDGAGRLASGDLPRGEDAGVYLAEAGALRSALDGEEDFPAAARRAGKGFGVRRGLFEGVLPLDRSAAVWDSAQDLARYASVTRLQREAAVRFIDKQSVYIGPQVTVGAGTVILPGTILRGETHIGPGCEIGPNTMIRDCDIGANVTVNSSQLNESVVEEGTTVGPFAYLRPNTHVGPHVKVGDFVELKNSVIGEGTKISHLTYVGDSDVGCHINFGCGTVTVNYDGAKKFRTRIGDGAFIGCNTNLVAPVAVGEGAYIAAGSTITRDVPSDSLAIARSQQTVKNQWAKKRRSKQGK